METNSQIIVKNTKKISQLPLAENIQNYLDTTYFILSGHFGSEDNGALATKRISAKAFIEDITANDDIQQSLSDLFEYSAITAIENSYLLVERDTSDAQYAHALRYRLNRQLPEFNEDYTTLAQDGLIDASTMLSYGATLENRFNGVLNVILNEPGTDNIIDTIIEFTNWFNGWTSNENNLRQLLSKIAGDINTAKTEAINTATTTSKNYTDEKITQVNQTITKKINNLDVSNQITSEINKLDVLPIGGGDDEYIKSVFETDGKISATVGNISEIRPTLRGGTNISITENTTINCNIGLDSTNNKSFTIGDTQYSLNFNNGKFYISELTDTYVTFKFNTKTPTDLTKEYDEDGKTGETSITLKFSVNKDGTVSGAPKNWNLTNDAAITAGTEYSYTMNNCPVNTDTEFNISIKENELSDKDISFGHIQTTINYKVINTYTKFGVWIFSSAAQIETDIFDLDNSLQLVANGVSNVKKILWSGTTSISTSINIGTNNEYVYVLIPEKWDPSTYKFFWGGSTTPEDANLVCSTVKLYSTNEVYYLYRSLRVQSGNNFSVEYRQP